MARSNAAGFLAGFLGAANEDSKRRQKNTDKRIEMNQTLLAKRKEIVFMNEYKEYKASEKFHDTLATIEDPVARQRFIADFKGIDPTISQARPLSTTVPERLTNPMNRLKPMEERSPRSPLIRKLREGAANLSVAMGFKPDGVPVAPAPSPRVPEVPTETRVPTQIAAPTQAELDTLKKPTKLKSTYDAKLGQMIFTDETKGTSFAVEVADLKKAPGEMYRVTVESTDDETGKTVKSIQNFTNDPETGTPVKVGEAAEISAKAKITKASRADLGLSTEAEINNNVGTFTAMGLSNEAAVAPTKFMLGRFKQLVNMEANKDANPEELRRQAIIYTIAREVPIQEVVDSELIGGLGNPLAPDGGFNAEVHGNYTALFQRLNDSTHPEFKSASWIKARNQIRALYN